MSTPDISKVAELRKQFNEELTGIGPGIARKKAVSFTDLPPNEKVRIGKLSPPAATAIKGAACKRIIEPLPHYIRAGCEKVYQGRNNSCIVLGRDRPGSRFEGYGGKGHTKSGMIDMVVGRLGSNSSYAGVQADPDFDKDSARIYISQRTDVDDNFGLAQSPGALRSTARASIAIKADTVRVIGREGIRLSTEQGTSNSVGGLIQSRMGIDLVAGNDDSNVQPMVRGKNLMQALAAIVAEIDDLRSTFSGFVNTQHSYNVQIQNHTHHSPFFGKPKTSPAPNLLISGMKTTMDTFSKTIVSTKMMSFNLEAFKKNFLNPGITFPEDSYICSRYNHVN
jgi:hypothetical protein